jgi:hypothetical protein
MKAGAEQETLHRERERLLDLEVEYSRTSSHLSGLSAMGDVRKAMLQMVGSANQLQRMREERDSISSRLGIGLGRGYWQPRINNLESERAGLRQRIDVSFAKAVKGEAEVNFQTIRDAIQVAKDSSMSNLMDAAERLHLSEKGTSRAWLEVQNMLSKGQPSLIDVKDIDAAEGLIREKIGNLTNAASYADKALADAAERLTDMKPKSDEYKKLKAEIEGLRQKSIAAHAELADFSADAEKTVSDFYHNIAGMVDTNVRNLTEDIRKSLESARYDKAMTGVDKSFTVMGDKLADVQSTVEKWKSDYESGAGIFARLAPGMRDEVFDGGLRKFEEISKTLIISRADKLTAMGDSMKRFMESASDDLRRSEKNFFDFRMDSPFFVGMRPRLIQDRMNSIDISLHGRDGLGGVAMQRGAALEKARYLFAEKDFGGAMKAMEEARKLQQKAVGFEEEKLGFIRMQADKEREINDGLYQLAATLLGKFEATSQTAVDADSAEAIHLQSRRIGENVAPPVSFDAQAAEQRMWEAMRKESESFARMLAAQMQEAYAGIGDIYRQGSEFDAPASKMGSAADKMNAAATKIQNMAGKPLLNVKRI